MRGWLTRASPAPDRASPASDNFIIAKPIQHCCRSGDPSPTKLAPIRPRSPQSKTDRRMKAAPFEYLRPRSVDEACACLAADADAVIIAGGQTLVPMMAMRLARPSRLVDIARIPQLHGIRHDG